MSSVTYIPKVTEAIINSQDVMSPVVRVFKTEIDESPANKSTEEKRCRQYMKGRTASSPFQYLQPRVSPRTFLMKMIAKTGEHTPQTVVIWARYRR